ncbi:MAG: bifunctional hydroxymethylpyrimidine kinase/phosphomethylpyrimidine kinase [Chlamydiae bacterium]|nr:bifunctional hydroxymethylpyrimidine kinase/phosphomethylpyrimidine kinase [Chlamydiota bacterium]MBI3267163.1 bifunctional hydroxymethylpyrimidine kinase/phosphomethylpyrimidine kinase [Chlamydiota bacterium]
MKNSKSKPVVVIGSIALDTVKTPYGEVQNVLGGSATFFTLAARLFAPVQVVGVIGEDFPEKYLKVFKNSKADLEGLLKLPGKTFRWSGSYENPNEAITHDTQLNVFGEFDPRLPEHYRKTPYVFLANIHPALQERVLSQLEGKPLIACDTMNHWISSHRKELIALYKNVHIVFLNEGEAKLLTGEKLLVRAARQIYSTGPQWVIIKKGEHGVLGFDGKDFITLPGFPTEQVVDTTGAGDSFAGAFMGYLAKKGGLKKNIIQEALAYATVVASFTVEGFSIQGLKKMTCSALEKRYQKFLKMAGV